MDKAKNMWWVYIDRYLIVQTRSIGYKWVYYKTTYSRYKRISRAKWDKACISTLAEHEWKRKVSIWASGQINQKYDSEGKPCGASIINCMWHEPNKRCKKGYRRRTFEEVEQMYIQHFGLENKQMVA